jgi:hypothetical protein
MDTPPQRQPEFRTEWILVPLALLGMFYLLHHIDPAITWEEVMNLLSVQDRQRYTMLFHLCLVLTCIVIAVRIAGGKSKK